MLSPAASLVAVVLGLACTLLPALAACWLCAHHLGVLLRLRSAARVTRLDRPGSVVLSGRVLADEGEPEPVKIVIEQQRIASPRSPVVLWREVSRTPTLRPFVIALADGTEVKVEPDADTRIAGELSLEVERDWGPLASGARAAGDRRLRGASIRAGDAIQLVGALRASAQQRPKSSAFRGAIASKGTHDTPPPRSLVVRRHPFEPLLLSKRSLSRERVPRVVLHACACLVFLALGLTLQVGELASYYRLAAWGTPMWATVVISADPDAPPPQAGDRLRLALERGPARVLVKSEPIDADLAARVGDAQQGERPLRVAVLVSRSWTEQPTLVMGTRPRAPSSVLPLVALGIVASAGYFLAIRRARPWFERPRLDEREPGLEGALLSKAASS